TGASRILRSWCWRTWKTREIDESVGCVESAKTHRHGRRGPRASDGGILLGATLRCVFEDSTHPTTTTTTGELGSRGKSMSLRVLVQVWCEIDPTLNVRIDRQSGQPLTDPGDRLWRVSPLGRAGVAAAMQLGGAAVSAFALGSGHTEALRHALAAGAADAVELVADGADRAALSVPELTEWLR